MANRATQNSAIALSDRLREELKRIKKDDSLKQEYMANKLEISPSTFSRFMNEKINASPSLFANAMEQFLIDNHYVTTGIRSRSDVSPTLAEK